MVIVVTPAEVVEAGLWVRMCEVIGMNEWALNEGRIDGLDEITMTKEEAKEIGLI